MNKIKVRLDFIIEQYEVSIDDRKYTVLKRSDIQKNKEDTSAFNGNGADIEDENLIKKLLEAVRERKGE